MLDNMEGGLTLTLPSGIDINFNKNYSLLLSSDFSDEVSASADPEYEQFLADVWVGIVLTLMVLSCVCCMCSCLLYHKFQQWKRSIIEARNATNNVEAGGNSESESLPSYTVVSGLPSYEEALEQLKKVKEINKVNKEDVKSADNTTEGWIPRTPPTPIATLSVMNLFQKYKNSIPEVHNKPS